MSARVLGGGTVPVLHIEPDGMILRGLALPFGESALVEDPRSHDLVEEIMDESSIEHIAPNLPLLVSHDRDIPPVGIVRNTSISSLGIGIEAKLVGSDSELEGWRRRFRHGLSSGLSVGFVRQRRNAVYERPLRPGGLPVMRPRGVQVVECSLVTWPAFESAGVLSLSVRSAIDQDRHERTVETLEWLAARTARQAAK